MVLSRRLGHGMMYMPSRAGDGAANATWLWHDVTVDDHAKMTYGQICI
jgi:hypothetical protein